jgi:NADH:ubiquinone oxidoreductase subunit 2 (subunit N)
VNSIIGAYYYFRLIVVMYMREPNLEAGPAPAVIGFPLPVNVVLVVTAAGTVYFGLFPNQVLSFVLQSNLLGH